MAQITVQSGGSDKRRTGTCGACVTWLYILALFAAEALCRSNAHVTADSAAARIIETY